jgi:hypothetical protein
MKQKRTPRHRVSDTRGPFYWLRRHFKKRPCSNCQTRDHHLRTLYKRIQELESDNRELREENHSLQQEDRQTYARVQELINSISSNLHIQPTHSSNDSPSEYVSCKSWYIDNGSVPRKFSYLEELEEKEEESGITVI